MEGKRKDKLSNKSQSLAISPNEEKEANLSRVIGDMVATVVGIYIISEVEKALRSILDTDIRESQLWIESPSGKTIVALSFWQAIRVVRKRGWRLAKTEPKQLPLSRWQMLKQFITGKEKKR